MISRCFMALRNQFRQQCWNQWPEELKQRDKDTIKAATLRLKIEIDIIKFEQYLFFRQWMDLKAYANERGILLFGDIPIFVSYDSADVWANRDVFKLDAAGEMSVVAGVPPDYFQKTDSVGAIRITTGNICKKPDLTGRSSECKPSVSSLIFCVSIISEDWKRHGKFLPAKKPLK